MRALLGAALLLALAFGLFYHPVVLLREIPLAGCGIVLCALLVALTERRVVVGGMVGAGCAVLPFLPFVVYWGGIQFALYYLLFLGGLGFGVGAGIDAVRRGHRAVGWLSLAAMAGATGTILALMAWG